MIETEVLKVSGMTCAACSSRVERQLKKERRNHLCQCEPGNREARVQYDADILSPDDLIQVVEKAGYGAELFEEVRPEEIEAKKAKS